MCLCVFKAQDLGNKERYLREWEDVLKYLRDINRIIDKIGERVK